MGGRATSLTIGLAAPGDLPAQWALEFADGFAAECDRVGASVVGGDLTRSDQIVIAVTVIGACTQQPVLRSGARPGDVLALAGRQGWSAGGLAVLGRGFRSPRVLVEAYRRPEPPYDAGPAAADAGATSMIDVSDGLLADLGHIAERSGCAAAVQLCQLPHLPKGDTYDAVLRKLALECQLAGGDDYELCFTAPFDQHLAISRIAAELELPLWCIGEMVANPIDGPAGTVTVFDPDAKPVDFDHKGYDHFAPATQP
jgi:thiamine-monophosphate kinase